MERLKTLMAREGIKSQYALAKALGIGITVVNGWFTGKVIHPSDKHLNSLASFFRVHPAWLRYGDAQYAPTIDTEAQMLAEEIAQYGPEGINKTRQILKILFEDEKAQKRKKSA